ncbi:MAG TPA: hypothetical protein VER83_04800 [Candidatus Nanopelagicales bacterium]|nr:hypothetical protein [Candidatus Nanopelagicales bacterium]
MGPERPSLVRTLRLLLARLVDLLPGPPDHDAPADPLLADLDKVPPDERAARRRAWLAQVRRGRGEGGG